MRGGGGLRDQWIHNTVQQIARGSRNCRPETAVLRFGGAERFFLLAIFFSFFIIRFASFNYKYRSTPFLRSPHGDLLSICRVKLDRYKSNSKFILKEKICQIILIYLYWLNNLNLIHKESLPYIIL